ncbi:hypothetical protein RJP56_16830 [Shewanella baltica]|uniref:hypothetical protein n=1 Tax=Shewanella baltica TaxID=62322 RepID=UPI002871BCFA|nr:hypothetical protein [Shewanella baltica]MDR9767729.1 hypothetical protein [Shewanella baltica]
MKVTVGGMDAAVEPSGMSLWRVTGMTVLNHSPHNRVRTDVFFVAFLVELY